jgi:hypothetical protein
MTGSFDVTVADERTQLLAFLTDERDGIARLLEGLTDEQSRRRLVPSLTTPAGLVKHCAYVERVWFQVGLLGRTREEVGIPYTVDESFTLDEDDTVEALLADLRSAWAESDAAIAEHGLDDLVEHSRFSPLNLRWVIMHLVRELGCHGGHGEILREQILAADS